MMSYFIKKRDLPKDEPSMCEYCQRSIERGEIVDTPHGLLCAECDEVLTADAQEADDLSALDGVDRAIDVKTAWRA